MHGTLIKHCNLQPFWVPQAFAQQLCDSGCDNKKVQAKTEPKISADKIRKIAQNIFALYILPSTKTAHTSDSAGLLWKLKVIKAKKTPTSSILISKNTSKPSFVLVALANKTA